MKSPFSRRRNTFGWQTLVGAAVVAFAIVILLVRLIAPSFFMAFATPLLKAGTALSGGTAELTGVFHFEFRARPRSATRRSRRGMRSRRRTTSSRRKSPT